MRAYWILPNRDQQDDILASDGATTLPLRQILDPKLRPDGFSHGVPAELLEKYGPNAFDEILFAQQFPDWDGDKRLFSVSTPAGLDSSGRVVYLGLLFILEPHERPRFDVSYAGLSDEDKAVASRLIHRLTAPARGDSWAQSVRDLSELQSERRPATNVALDRSIVRFHSLYVFGPGGLTKKTERRMSARTSAIILLIVLVVVSLLSVHAMKCSGVIAVADREALQQDRLHVGGERSARMIGGNEPTAPQQMRETGLMPSGGETPIGAPSDRGRARRRSRHRARLRPCDKPSCLLRMTANATACGPSCAAAASGPVVGASGGSDGRSPRHRSGSVIFVRSRIKTRTSVSPSRSARASRSCAWSFQIVASWPAIFWKHGRVRRVS